MSDQLTRSSIPVLDGLTVKECRRRFASAFRHRPGIYWSDLLASASGGWVAFAVSAWVPVGSVGQITATIVAIGVLFRAALFIHELAHLKRGTLPGFEMVWTLVVGLPLMLPSLLYVGSHGDHHKQAIFGTSDDPEYAPLARWSRLSIAGFVASGLVVPLLLAFRWGVLGPLSCLVPPLRRFVVERASTLVINSDYRRPGPQGQHAVRWVLQETVMAITFWLVVAGWIMDWLPTRWLLQWYLVGAGIVLVNQIRTLAAHRYENNGQQLDMVGQLLDSVTLRGGAVLTVLAAPLGLRYHALHHLLPTVPYHSLGTLHRQLLRELPPHSPYRYTERGGILSVVRDLLHRAGRNNKSARISEDCAAGGV